jgi:hypothetical protein
MTISAMKGIPVLSDAERAELLTALKEAEARIESGKGIEYDPKAFRSRLLGIYRNAKRRYGHPHTD